MYAEVMKQTFAPKPGKEVKEIYELLQANFPFAKFCVYQGESIAPLQHHLSSNRIIYAETNRDSTETVFNFLKGKQRNAYLRPDKKMIYRYVDLDSRVFLQKKSYLRSSFAKGIRSSHAHAGKTIGGYIKGC